MKEQQDDAASQPGEVRSTAGLGLLPLPQPYMQHWVNCPFESIGLFTAEQMRAHVAQEVAAALARERVSVAEWRALCEGLMVSHVSRARLKAISKKYGLKA